MKLTEIIQKEFRRIAITGTLFLALAVGGFSCTQKNTYKWYEEHPVEQVFRDHNGYRLLYTDENSVVREKKYYSKGTCYHCSRIGFPEDTPDEIKEKFSYRSEKIVIIKDLAPGEKGYARVIHHDAYLPSIPGTVPATHVEIHIPKDKKIDPGTERWGGKFPKNANMGEIK